MTDLINRADAIEAVFAVSRRVPTMAIRAKYALESLPSAEAEWIPCGERLPEINTPVILCGKYNEVIGYRRNNSDWMAVSGDGWETDIEHPEDFIAWMPLPKPYEGSESDETD